jgi:hypothetical protein
MNYTELFTPHHIAEFANWLEEKRSLFVEIYVPHGGGSASLFTVHTLGEIRDIVRNLRSLEIQITIWKNYTQADHESDRPVPSDTKWLNTHVNEVMYFSVMKNRNWSEAYATNPGKYQGYVDEWLSDNLRQDHNS